MAVIPYMPFYVNDYLADTVGFTPEEHGCYIMLIFAYWQSRKPLEVSRLASIAHCSNERWIFVERTLQRFFQERDGFWHHKRVEEELSKYSAKVEANKKAGKASAAQRKLNARSTGVPTNVPTESQPRASDSVSDSGFSSSGSTSPSDKPVVVSIRSSRFSEWWRLWSAVRGTANQNDAFTAWNECVTFLNEDDCFLCTASYLNSLNDPAIGFNPQNFLRMQAQDGNFTARYPARKPNGKSTDADVLQEFRGRMIREMKHAG